MAHPQHGHDAPELRLRRLTEYPPRQGNCPCRAGSRALTNWTGFQCVNSWT